MVQEQDPYGRGFGESPAMRRRRNIFFGISGALVLLIIISFRAVMAPFALAVVLAYVLSPVVHSLQFHRKSARQRMPRWVAVLIVYLTLLASIVTTAVIAVPRLLAEGERLAHEAPRIVEQVRSQWMPRVQVWMNNVTRYTDLGTESAAAEDAATANATSAIRVTPSGRGYEVELPPRGIEVVRDGQNWRIRPAGPRTEHVQNPTAMITEALSHTMKSGEARAVTLIDQLQSIVRALISGIFTFSMMMMISAYMLITSDAIFAFFRSLIRFDRRHEFDDLIRRIDRGLSGVVRGQVLICVVNGVLSAIGFYIADLPYWPLLTLIATVLSLVPIFGSIISSVPAVLLGFQHGFGVALFVLLWIIGIHQLEANFLNPKIMGDSAKVHPVLVIFALLAGEHFAGALGALLAVPVLSITQSLFLHFRMVSLGMPASSTAIPPPME